MSTSFSPPVGFGAGERPAVVDVSVIVTTYNRAATLAETLTGLLGQQVSPPLTYEILVINDGSTDDTLSVLAEASRTSSVFRSITTENSGVGHARAVGVRSSTGQWIAFCDDDQVPDPQWLEALYTVATQHNAACVGGPVSLRLPESFKGSLSPRARLLLGEDDFGSQVRTYPKKAHPGTGNVMIHRDVFARVGHFDGEFLQGGEDAELFHRIQSAGFLTLYAPQAHMWHIIPPSRVRPEFLHWVSRRIGVASARIDHKHKSPIAIIARCGVRITLLVTRDLFRLMVSPFFPALWLDVRCSWAYTGAYLRAALHFSYPSLTSQDRLFAHLSFQHHGGERSVASQPSEGPVA